MRIGVFGGSFDPPHAGHAAVAEAARSGLGLDRLIWVPAFAPPHKEGPVAPFPHRLAMVRALIAGLPWAEASDIEAALPEPSYTLHTLRALKARLGPGHAWHLVLGADAWKGFPTWHQPEAVLSEASLAVYPRGEGLPAPLPPGATLLAGPQWDPESNRLRAGLHDARTETLAELPPAVADYIRKHGLYGGERQAE